MTLQNVVVATDFSEASDAALLYGRELAKRFDATLHVLHVTQDIYLNTLGAGSYVSIAPDLQQRIEEAARQRLHGLLIDTDGSGPPTIPALVRSSSPASAIVDYAVAHNIDVIVMGTHGRGALSHLVMGSVAERVVRLAPCPVLTVRQSGRDFVHADTLATVARAS